MDLKNKVLLGVVSATLVAGTVKWEGTRYTPYEDVVGVLTVCNGHTGPDVKWGQKYTPEQCDAMLKKDLRKYREYVYGCIRQEMTQGEFDAFTMFTYNMGPNKFCNAAFVREFNKGNNEKACRMMATHPNGNPAWSHAGGKYYQGLQNRRLFEREMCLGSK